MSQEKSFDPEKHKLLPYVHVLDLQADGYIKPHIGKNKILFGFDHVLLAHDILHVFVLTTCFFLTDSVRFCGDVVAVLSLMSDSVARLKMDRLQWIYLTIEGDL